MHYMHGYGSIWPMIGMIIFLAGLIIIGLFLVSNYVSGGRKKDSLGILKERLAKGEIDESEYERLKSILEE
ncbi:SHOCT domain-containing protein [Lentibacillus salinarum]|uniref:SHOCT domain-containing protein n=1 Tax=Lentibacillus salinarum TaxID=446820 RepID=A0ABW3ZY87_9BACI